MSIPDYLIQGEEARLIPVATGSHRECAACSVLLAVLRIVEPFASAILAEMGRRVGTWASLSTFTEVVFANQPDGSNCRHDGLLVFDTGRRQWRALIECKIGAARIESEQIAQYYRVAKANGIDAIITISNELTSRPTHVPYDVPHEIRNIELYHWSWSHLGMLADLLLKADQRFDDEQELVLREMVRYLDHESSEVKCFTQMGGSWAPLVQRISADGPVTRNDVDVVEAVRCWHQAQEAVCIFRARELKLPVSVWLSRSHREDQGARLDDDIADFVEEKSLHAWFEIPDLAAPIELVANVVAKNLICRLSVQAPLDRQRYPARLRWLLNQLPEESDHTAIVNFVWDRGARSQASIGQLLSDPNAGRLDGAVSAPNYFEVVSVSDLAGRFAGSRNFVSALDEAVAYFYESIAKHIRPWEPPRTSMSAAELDDEAPGIPREAAAPEIRDKQITQRGQVNGRAFSVFDDGSIEIDTGKGIQRFKNRDELRAAAARNGSSEHPR